MGKTLRICLAMGGGVSLGSFSGSALTEALKLLLLFGKDKKGNKYDDVIVDGMSGASAGAIALTILMRCLLDYKSMISIYNRRSKTNIDQITEETLLNELSEDYFIDIESFSSEIKEKLIALQVTQKIQKQIWTVDVDTDELFRVPFPDHPHKSFGYLNRNILTELAKDYITDSNNFNLENRQILDSQRVLFACSLTNILPMTLNGGISDTNGNNLMENFIKSTDSQNHTELRVFDLIFEKDENNVSSDKRWIELRNGLTNDSLNGSGKDNRMIHDLSSRKGWSIMAASALACGAFPIAFDPILLKRFSDEYGKNEWPRAFEDIQNEIAHKKEHSEKVLQKSFFSEDEHNYIDYKSFNFPYIDGGTFNNEPIKEAFRIASFQDFGRKDDYDRLVLFVDPIVRIEKYLTNNVKSYQSVSTNLSLKSKEKGITSKLFDNISNVIGLLAQQGSIKEEHRIKDAMESFKLRNAIFSFINGDDSDSNPHSRNFYKTMTGQLMKTAFYKIDAKLNSDIIPPGTRDIVAYFEQNYKEQCSKNNLSCSLPIDKKIYNKIFDELKKSEPEKERIFELFNEEILKENDVIQINRKNLFSQTVLRMMTDCSLNTVGKDVEAELMAILPVEMEDFQTVELPGNEVSAFAGFASKESREYAFEYGRLATLVSLKKIENGYRDSGKGENPILSGVSINLIQESLKNKIGQLAYFKTEYSYSEDIKSKLYEKLIMRTYGITLPQKGIKRWIATKVPLPIAGLLGGIWFKGLSSLNGVIRKELDVVADEINYKKLVPITISILSRSQLKGKMKRCWLRQKGNEIKITMQEYDQTPESRGYQYVFQLYYLNYIQPERNTPKPESTSVYLTADGRSVERVSLTYKKWIRNPSLDNILESSKYRKAIEEESRKIEIEGLRIGHQTLGDIIADINNRDFSLFYSLKNLNYHVNPMLEFNMDKDNEGWIFKENTKAYFYNLYTSED